MAGMNVMNGTVKWFDVRKGYFVPDEDEHGRAMAREVTVISEEE